MPWSSEGKLIAYPDPFLPGFQTEMLFEEAILCVSGNLETVRFRWLSFIVDPP